MACMHPGHISTPKIIYDMSKTQIASIKDNRSYNFLGSLACIRTHGDSSSSRCIGVPTRPSYCLVWLICEDDHPVTVLRLYRTVIVSHELSGRPSVDYRDLNVCTEAGPGLRRFLTDHQLILDHCVKQTRVCGHLDNLLFIKDKKSIKPTRNLWNC